MTEHYQLHWEFFKSVNPEASESFFIDLQLKKISEILEKGFDNIDFPNDNTQTLEGYLNDNERQNFFFNKEYKEYLEKQKNNLLNGINMQTFIFETNINNAFTISEKHNLSEYDRDYIHKNFWPIIKVNNYDEKTIKEKLNNIKDEFITENTNFDLEIFNRQNTEYLTYEINQYIDILKKGKAKFWNNYGEDFYYIFKLESDAKDKTLIISDKNITQLEIYFKSILKVIQEFIMELTTKSNNPQTKITKTELPNIEDVFFVHYQCDDFNLSTKINSLSIYVNGKTIEFNKVDEIDNIKKYVSKVNELQNQNFIPVHWNQNRTYYGADHIKQRYFELTENELNFEYKNDINLSMWLVIRYGTGYIKHPKLNNLSDLNDFNCNSETAKGNRTFDTNRLMLLVKIYFNALNGTLKTDPQTPDLSDTSTVEKTKPKKPKKVLFQFIHNIKNKEEFIQELKETFPTEIGKSIKAIIDILTDEKILVYGTKEFKTLKEEIEFSFNRNIGSYNSIQNVKIVDKETTDTVHKKLNPLIIKHKTP